MHNVQCLGGVNSIFYSKGLYINSLWKNMAFILTFALFLLLFLSLGNKAWKATDYTAIVWWSISV